MQPSGAVVCRPRRWLGRCLPSPSDTSGAPGGCGTLPSEALSFPVGHGHSIVDIIIIIIVVVVVVVVFSHPPDFVSSTYHISESTITMIIVVAMIIMIVAPL